MAVHVSRIFTPFTIYTVTNTLTNVTTNNDVIKVISGKEYTATLTVEAGYTNMSVTVMMGGTDITSTSYLNGVITITEVTGDILITATGLSTVAVTITGTGNARLCYAIINGTNQYEAGTHEVNAGDTITFGIIGSNSKSPGWVTIDGTKVLEVTKSSKMQTYDWTVPNSISTVEIAMKYATYRYGRITVTTA